MRFSARLGMDLYEVRQETRLDGRHACSCCFTGVGVRAQRQGQVLQGASMHLTLNEVGAGTKCQIRKCEKYFVGCSGIIPMIPGMRYPLQHAVRGSGCVVRQ